MAAESRVAAARGKEPVEGRKAVVESRVEAVEAARAKASVEGSTDWVR